MSLVTLKKSELSKVDLVNTEKGMTGSAICTTYNPDAVLNAALYDMATKTNIVFLKDNHVTDGYYFADEGIGITTSGEMIWVEKDKAYSSNEVVDYLSGAPVLVRAGKVGLSWGNKISSAIQGKALRTAIGFNDSQIFLYASDDKITLTTLATRMKDYGCLYAINLDGGGSQHLWANGTRYKTSVRANKSWFLFYLKKQVDIKGQEQGENGENNKTGDDDKMAQYKITANTLNIRKGAGTSYAKVGTYSKNTLVEVTEIKNGWGKTNKGWISMQYAELVQQCTSTSTTSIIRDIGYLHPKVQELCNQLLEKCKAEGLNVGLFETYRTDDRQQYLYTQGSTTIKTRGAHGYCVAFDIVAKDCNGNWTWDTKDKTILKTYNRVGEIGKALGLEWGGDWTSFVDMPHFQYLGGISLTNYGKNKRPTWWDSWVIGTNQPIKYTIAGQCSDWAASACTKAIEKELIQGDGNGNYGWTENITLERFIVILDKLGLLDSYNKK